VAPTVVLTEAAEKWQSDEKRWQALLARIPLGRVAEARDVANAALFFSSPASDFVTGKRSTSTAASPRANNLQANAAPSGCRRGSPYR
jgi:NAD(P)-dependent dehydrogenase (short-subunit alcohol dehydrogenase family)